jgi:beta-lactamase class A
VKARLLAMAALVLAIPAAASGAEWRPHVAEAARWAAERHGVVAFAVRTPSGAWGWHARRTFPSASVLKPMLMVSYLHRRPVRRRALRSWEKRLLSPMIRRSDNAAASALLARVGGGGLRALARRARMRRFRPVLGVWGNSRICAEDQARFFLRIDGLLPARHRDYGMRLLRRIVRRQRWGIAQVAPRGWRLYFKGGWGSGSGRVDHQVALLVRGRQRVSVAILTYADGSHAYGKATLRGVARRLLRGLSAPASAK